MRFAMTGVAILVEEGPNAREGTDNALAAARGAVANARENMLDPARV